MKLAFAIAAAGVVVAGALIALNYNTVATKISEAVDSFKNKSEELKFPEETGNDF